MKTEIAANILRTKLHDTIRLMAFNDKSIEGKVVFIFPANKHRRVEDVKKYYAIDTDHKSFHSLKKTTIHDAMVIQYSDSPELYYIVPRCWQATNWLKEYGIVKGV